MTEDLASKLASLTPQQRQALAARMRLRKAGPPGDDAAMSTFPLSHAQERLWFLDRLEPGDPTYTIGLGIRISGSLRVDVLHRALTAVVAEHDALRLVFAESTDGPQQTPRPVVPVDLPVTDLRAFGPRSAQAAEHAAAHAGTRIGLTAGPVFALRLLVLAEGDHLLMVAVHHIAFDGWSGSVFLADLAAEYERLAAQAPAGRRPAGVRFTDHVRRERQELTPQVLASQLGYWCERLDGAPPLSTVPTDLPRPQVQLHRAGHQAIRLERGLCDDLDLLARRLGITVGSVIIAGVAAIVHARSGARDILLGVPVAGRPRAELEHVIGCFANTVVVRVAVTQDLSAAALARAAHQAASGAYAHQAAPFAKVVEALAPPRDLSRNPLFQIMVGFTELGTEASHTVAGTRLVLQDLQGERTDFDMFLNLRREDGEITGVLTYDKDLYLDQTAAEVTAELRAVLGHMCADEHAPGALPALRRRLVTVSASFTADPLAAVASFWSGFLGVALDVDMAAYGQVFQQLIGGADADAGVVLLRWDDWVRRLDDAPDESLLYRICDDLADAVRAYRARTTAPLVIVICPGELGSSLTGRRLDDALLRAVRAIPGVDLLLAEQHAARYAVRAVFDPGADELGHVPFTEDFYAVLGTLAVRRVLAAWGHSWPADSASSARGGYIREFLCTAAAIAERARPQRPAVISAGGHVAPRTEAEARLAALWRELPGLAEAGVTTEFFAVGGTSLSATWLVSRIREEFGRPLSLREFFACPTIAELAARLEDAATERAAPALTPPPAARRDQPLPPSSVQERMWLLSKMDESGAAQNTSYTLRLRGALRVSELRGALVAVTERHDGLRTSFIVESDRPAVVIARHIDPWLPAEDVSGLPDPQAAAWDVVLRDARRRYDLTAGPLIRARVIRVAADDHYLALGMHHAVCDDASWGLVLAELCERYNAAVTGTALEVAPPAAQFPDFAAWQSQRLLDGGLDEHLDYWRAQFAEPGSAVVLRADEDGRAPSGTAGNAVFRLPAELGKRMRDVSRAEGVSVFAVLLTGLCLAFRASTGVDDLTLGVVVAGRDQPGTRDVVGSLADLLPVRIDSSGRPAFRGMLQRVRRAVGDAVAHQDAPFAAIVDAVRALGGPSGEELLRHVVNYVERPEPSPRLHGLAAEPVDVPADGADFDTFTSLWWDSDELVADVRFDRGALDPDDIRLLLQRFEEALAAGVQRPAAPLPVAARQPSADARPQALAVVLATNLPSWPAEVAAGLWSRALDLPVRLDLLPPGRILQPLADPDAGLPASASQPCALLLRWSDLGRPDASHGPRATWELERALPDLVAALREFRAWSAAPLTVVWCPESGLPAGMLAGLGDRLSAAVRAITEVRILSGAQWCARYGVEEIFAGGSEQAGDGVGYTAQALAALMTAVLHTALRRAEADPRWLALDPSAWDPIWLRRFAARQVAAGRTVVLAGGALPPPAPDGVLVTAAKPGPELAGFIASAVLDPGAGVVLDVEPSDGREPSEPAWSAAPPSLPAVTVPGAQREQRERFLERFWPLELPDAVPESPGHPPRRGVLAAAAIARQYPDATAIALAAADDAEAPGTPGRAPDTPAERALADIWSSLLRVAVVTASDDFFDLGGDSMLAIEVAYRAGAAGLNVTPKLVTSLRTLSLIARAAGSGPAAPDPAVAPGLRPERDRASGTAPLGPAQSWFIEEVAPGMGNLAHYNNPYYLELEEPLASAHVAGAVARLARHHEGLRLRLLPGQDGWRQSCFAPGDGIPFDTVDLSAAGQAEREEAMAERCAREQRSLSLSGPLARAVYFRLGDGKRDRLFLALHHLVTDGVSRGVLFEDLAALLRASDPGHADLAPALSYLDWAALADEHAQSAQTRAELPFWLAQRPASDFTLPMDRPGRMTFGTLRHRGLTLSDEETAALLAATRRRGRKLNEVLLWVVADYLSEWTGRSECGLAVVIHGRDPVPGAPDTSRAVGWLQGFYPLHVTLPGGRADPGAAAEVAAQLSAVPGGGGGWSALRYSCRDPEVRRLMEGVRLPRVSFNYMGYFNFDTTSQGSGAFRICHASYGREQEDTGIAAFDLDFVLSFLGKSLNVEVNYDPGCHTEQTVDLIHAGIYRRLIAVLDDPRAQEG